MSYAGHFHTHLCKLQHLTASGGGRDYDHFILGVCNSVELSNFDMSPIIVLSISNYLKKIFFYETHDSFFINYWYTILYLQLLNYILL